ncbi:LLM class flavin-dependent oxidoreductase [Kribbella albertanoniae]|uniref:LLM class flavin-dependent oxidoreductase n=1 Tax=Kribbella albertanoniae TaxID=1266829 RepID=A0A4R4QIL3_9ACTN|nr:LLM class flavin-dependent oxidoreductase [Kribbella albertanoniae]TDC35507.1 LLM class flavin-dependent oxidoreductase [Kribbella albertanoniae]
MRLGVLLLPEVGWQVAQDQWRMVEDLGFDAGWTIDHLFWRTLRDGPWFSTFPWLCAAATATDRLSLGVLVTSPTFRHPVLVAKDAIAIDDISGGRFALGLGAGSAGAGDADVIEPVLPARQRADRFEEFVEVTDLLLREPLASYNGSYYTVKDARNFPGCVQSPRVPLCIAAAGPRGMRLAARHGDAWVCCGPVDLAAGGTPELFLTAVQEQSRQLSRECTAIGRDPAALRRILVLTEMADPLPRSVDLFVERATEYARAGITDLVVPIPRPSGVHQGDPGLLAELASTALPLLRELSSSRETT